GLASKPGGRVSRGAGECGGGARPAASRHRASSGRLGWLRDEARLDRVLGKPRGPPARPPPVCAVARRRLAPRAPRPLKCHHDREEGWEVGWLAQRARPGGGSLKRTELGK